MYVCIYIIVIIFLFLFGHEMIEDYFSIMGQGLSGDNDGPISENKRDSIF